MASRHLIYPCTCKYLFNRILYAVLDQQRFPSTTPRHEIKMPFLCQKKSHHENHVPAPAKCKIKQFNALSHAVSIFCQVLLKPADEAKDRNTQMQESDHSEFRMAKGGFFI